MTQFLLFIWIISLGALITQMGHRHWSAAFSAASAPLWGLGLTAILLIANALVGAGRFLPAAMVIEGVCLQLWLLWYLHSRALLRPGVLLGTILVWVPVALLVSHVNLAVLSYDSFELSVLGKKVASVGVFTDFLTRKLASWGILYPALHGLVVLTDLDFLFGLQPLIGTALLASWLAIAVDITAGHASTSQRMALIAAIAVVIFSSYFLPFQFFYLHNSLPAAAFLLMATWLAWKNLTTGDSWFILPATASFTLFALLRTETPILAAMFVAVWHLQAPAGRRHFRVLLAGFTVPVLGWYAYLLAGIGGGSDILTPARIGMVVSPVAGATLLSGMLARGQLLQLRHRLLPIVPVSMIILVVVLFVARTDHMHTSLHALVLNMFERGRWGALWWAFTGLGLLAALRASFRFQAMWILPVVTYAVFILAVSAFRIPYHTGFGDSGNRMLTHIVPLIGILLAARLARPAARDAVPMFAARLVALLVCLLAALELNMFVQRDGYDYTRNTVAMHSQNIDTANTARHALLNKSRWKHMVASATTAAVEFTFGHTIELTAIRTDHLSPSSLTRITLLDPAGNVVEPNRYSVSTRVQDGREFGEVHFVPAWHTDGLTMRYQSPNTDPEQYWRLASIYFRESRLKWQRLFPEQNLAALAVQLPTPAGKAMIDLAPVLADPPIESARATQAGPLTAVVDLGAVKSVRELGMIVYSHERRPTQYRWLTSSNKEQWQVLFDSQALDNSVIETRPDPIVWIYNLHTHPAFRYLRFEFEESAHEENLFRIRKLYMMGMP